MDHTQLRRNFLEVKDICDGKAVHAASVTQRCPIAGDVHEDAPLFTTRLIDTAMRAQGACALGFFIDPVKPFIPADQAGPVCDAVDATKLFDTLEHPVEQLGLFPRHALFEMGADAVEFYVACKWRSGLVPVSCYDAAGMSSPEARGTFGRIGGVLMGDIARANPDQFVTLRRVRSEAQPVGHVAHRLDRYPGADRFA